MSEETNEKKKKGKPKSAVIIAVIALAAVAVTGCVLLFGMKKADEKAALQLKNDYFKQPHDAIFVSMYDPSGFLPEDFTTYRGLDTCVVTFYKPADLKEMTSFLNRFGKVLASKQESENALAENEKRDSVPLVKHLFLGVSPDLFSSEEDVEAFKTSLGEFYADKDIDLLLAPYSGRYLLSLGEERLDDIKDKPKTFVCAFDDVENVHIYFPGSTLWLSANPDCYIEGSHSAPEESVASKIIRYCFCDGAYEVGGPNINDAIFEWSRNLSTIEKNPLMLDGADLKNHEITFFGDSIIGHYEGPLSAPGVVEAFSGAKTESCGIGGMPLTDNGVYPGLYGMLDYSDENAADFAEKTSSLGMNPDSANLTQAISNLRNEEAAGERDIVIEFGINDYQAGLPTDEFEKSLKKDLDYIKNQFHYDRILIVAPYFIWRDDLQNGEMPVGNGGTLNEYREILKNTAEEYGCLYLDLRDMPGENLLESDGIHLNENGRLYMGLAVIESLLNG
ncbi:MAG: SGNH/GDSL hydrolase family protein [Lachnospiraceae bacterium]|nr:SGNH/GDSL hydrolase family protein [Lachnospiraceae bacterium]